MFRAGTRGLVSAVSATLRSNVNKSCAVTAVRQAHGHEETAEEFDARYETYLNRPDIDGWELRKALNDIQGHDLVPEPKIIIAAMSACRRLNDYALAVRYLEAVQEKCGQHKDKIWPYILQEIKPTLEKLSILTPEQMGYDKPELATMNVYDIH